MERIISWFYYIRAPWYPLAASDGDRNETVVQQTAPFMTIRELKQTMEECFSGSGGSGGRQAHCAMRPGMSVHGDPGMPEFASQMTFFCGNAPECDEFDGEAMLRRAVENVERYFAVVGVLEELDASVRILEALLPRYFSGAAEILARQPTETERHKNRNIYKQAQSRQFRAALAANLTREMEFYHFCRQRLRKQMALIQ